MSIVKRRLSAKCQGKGFRAESRLDHFEMTDIVLVIAFNIDPVIIGELELPLNEKVPVVQTIFCAPDSRNYTSCPRNC